MLETHIYQIHWVGVGRSYSIGEQRKSPRWGISPSVDLGRSKVPKNVIVLLLLCLLSLSSLLLLLLIIITIIIIIIIICQHKSYDVDARLHDIERSADYC